MNVVCLSVYPAEGPSVRHRITAYARYWRAAGIDLTLWPFLTAGLFANRRRFGWGWTVYKAAHFAFGTLRLAWRVLRLRRFDAVIIHREAFPLGGAWFERLAARVNPCVAFDFDDAIWLRMPLAVDQRAFLWDPGRVADTLSASAVAVAGNEYLADYARQHARQVFVIPTSYDDLGGSANPEPAPAGPPVVVWIGNVGNEEYLDFLRAPLARLAREAEFVFRLIGSREAAGFAIEGVRTEVLEWREDHERAWLLDASIGVMPLADRDYERGKCAFKILQYFSAGLAVVATPVGMNAELIRPRENGLLAQTQEQWYEALRELLADAAQRRRLGQAGYATFRQRFTRDANAREWMRVFEHLRGNT